VHIVFSQLESHFSTFEFFLLGKSLDFEIRNQNFRTRRFPGDVPVVSMVHPGRTRRERSSTALCGTSVAKHTTLHMINTTL
jgi:hypothetical protein